MKKVTLVILLILAVFALPADASLFNLNGLKKNFGKNFNLFCGNHHHHHKPNLGYYAQLPLKPVVPVKPDAPFMPDVPGLPVVPVIPVIPVTPQPVPEAASIFLLGGGLAALAVVKRSRKANGLSSQGAAK